MDLSSLQKYDFPKRNVTLWKSRMTSGEIHSDKYSDKVVSNLHSLHCLKPKPVSNFLTGAALKIVSEERYTNCLQNNE